MSSQCQEIAFGKGAILRRERKTTELTHYIFPLIENIDNDKIKMIKFFVTLELKWSLSHNSPRVLTGSQCYTELHYWWCRLYCRAPAQYLALPLSLSVLGRLRDKEINININMYKYVLIRYGNLIIIWGLELFLSLNAGGWWDDQSTTSTSHKSVAVTTEQHHHRWFAWLNHHLCEVFWGVMGNNCVAEGGCPHRIDVVICNNTKYPLSLDQEQQCGRDCQHRHNLYQYST